MKTISIPDHVQGKINAFPEANDSLSYHPKGDIPASLQR